MSSPPLTPIRGFCCVETNNKWFLAGFYYISILSRRRKREPGFWIFSCCVSSDSIHGAGGLCLPRELWRALAWEAVWWVKLPSQLRSSKFLSSSGPRIPGSIFPWWHPPSWPLGMAGEQAREAFCLQTLSRVKPPRTWQINLQAFLRKMLLPQRKLGHYHVTTRSFKNTGCE